MRPLRFYWRSLQALSIMLKITDNNSDPYLLLLAYPNALWQEVLR